MAEPVLRELSNGVTMRFSKGETPEVIDRVIARENDKIVKADLADDSGLETAGKWGQTLARGTGEGLAQTADLPFQGAQYLFEVGKNMWEEGHGRPYERKSVASPITDAYNEVVGDPIPGYEKVNDYTAIVAPALLESAASVGVGTPAAIGAALARQGAKRLPTIARHVGGAAVRIPARAAATTAVGIGGAKLGGAAGEYIGGDIGKEIGEGVGGIFAGGIGPGGKALLKRRYFDADSEEVLRRIQRLNKDNNAQIPITSGLLSPKILGAKEDQLARNIGSGQKVMQTRRDQFSGYDRAKQDIAAKARGGESGGPITEASVGDDIIAMMANADASIGTKMKNVQNALEAQAGELSPTDAWKVETALRGVSSNRALSAALREQADRLRAGISKNYEPVEPDVTIQGPPTPSMTYGATKDVRSNVGSTLPEENISKQVTGPAYDALTDQMKETYSSSGGDPDFFDAQQEEYKRLRKQQESVEKHRGTSTKAGEDTAATTPESQAYRKLYTESGDVRPFEPYEEHTKPQLDKIMADALELETRGPNAGRDIDPERVDTKGMRRNWTDRPDRWKEMMTRGNPTLARMLDDVAYVEATEASRAGKRAVPTATGSTIGEGYSNNTLPVTGSNIGGFWGAVTGALLNPTTRKLRTKAYTNETANTRLFDPEPLAVTLGRAATGATEGQKAVADKPFTGNVGDTLTITDEEDPMFGQSGKVSGVGRNGNAYTIRMPDGTERTMGNRLLKPADQ